MRELASEDYVKVSGGYWLADMMGQRMFEHYVEALMGLYEGDSSGGGSGGGYSWFEDMLMQYQTDMVLRANQAAVHEWLADAMELRAQAQQQAQAANALPGTYTERVLNNGEWQYNAATGQFEQSFEFTYDIPPEQAVNGENRVVVVGRYSIDEDYYNPNFSTQIEQYLNRHLEAPVYCAPQEQPPDEASQDIYTLLTDLTPDEDAAVAALRSAIADVAAAVAAIPDGSRIVFPDGSVVTGAEIKAAWAKNDFVINESGHPYDRAGALGEANWNGGNPVTSFNIDNLVTLNNPAWGANGMNWLVAHELAHYVGIQRGTYDWTDPTQNHLHEQQANDIARAIAGAGGIPIFGDGSTPAPGDGYSTGSAMQFGT